MVGSVLLVHLLTCVCHCFCHCCRCQLSRQRCWHCAVRVHVLAGLLGPDIPIQNCASLSGQLHWYAPIVTCEPLPFSIQHPSLFYHCSFALSLWHHWHCSQLCLLAWLFWHCHCCHWRIQCDVFWCVHLHNATPQCIVFFLSIHTQLTLRCVSTAPSCPAFSAGLNLATGCTCLPGYSGTISATSTSPFFTGSCIGEIHDWVQLVLLYI